MTGVTSKHPHLRKPLRSVIVVDAIHRVVFAVRDYRVGKHPHCGIVVRERFKHRPHLSYCLAALCASLARSMLFLT